MTTDPQLINLLSVVVGGLLAVIGGGVTQWYLHKSKLDDDVRNKLAEKFEELVLAVYEFDHWLNTYRNIQVFGAKGLETSSPYAKIHAITLLYFPEFTELVTKLDHSSLQYQTWMLEKGFDRLSNKTDHLAEGNIAAWKPYREVRDELLSELQSFTAVNK